MTLYAFSKSHAVCYAWLAYQSAYLKAHYPEEFAEVVGKGRLGLWYNIDYARNNKKGGMKWAD